MNREINKLGRMIISKVNKLNILEISGERWKVSGENTSYKRVNYPEIDICEKKIEGNFNLIIAEMVFEHLKFPYRAGKHIYEMLESEGYFLISVPFLYPIHDHPIDCSRWSKVGLKYFMNECGFDMNKITTDAWGNRKCLQEICLGDKPIVFYRGQSLENEANFPISVWGLAQK